MKLSLVVMTAGKQEGKLLAIPLAQFVIGRDPQCHLRPASPSISKRHCALIQREGKVFVRDFDSTNGTSVNDVPVKGEVELHNEDILKVGPLHFGVKIETSPAVNRPTPAPPTRKAAQASPAAAIAPSAPAAAPKPAPAPAAAAKKEPQKTALGDESSADDDVAAMLLSLQDDAETGSGLAGEVPEGSTVMDMGTVPIGPDGAPAPKKEEEKPKPPPQTTANAAKALLEKYMKRPR